MNDNQSEQIVLGTAMQATYAPGEIFSRLRPDDFYSNAHRLIASAILELYNDSDTVKVSSVQHALLSSGKLTEAGGAEYLHELENMSNPLRLVEKCDQILSLSMIRSADSAVARFKGGALTMGKLIDELSAIEMGKSAPDDGREFDAIEEAVNEMVENAKNKVAMLGIDTGLRSLNEMTDGWISPNVYCFGARASMGKTSLMLQLKEHLIDTGYNGYVVSMETTSKQLVFRQISGLLGKSVSRIRKGIISEEEWRTVHNWMEGRKGIDTFIHDETEQTIESIRQQVRHLKRKFGIKWLMIDYMQLIEEDTKFTDKNPISSGIRSICKEFDIFAIVVFQLNRAVELRGGDKRPMLSDARGNGGFEQDAYFVGLLYRPEYYGFTTDEYGNPYEEGHTELIIAKQKDGPTGTIYLKFHKEFMRFTDYDMTLPPPRVPIGDVKLPF